MENKDDKASEAKEPKCTCGGNIIMFTPDLDICQSCGKQYEPLITGIESPYIEITHLKAELERERELRKELVDCLEVHQTKWISAEHYWGSDTNEWAESLIKKSKKGSD